MTSLCKVASRKCLDQAIAMQADLRLIFKRLEDYIFSTTIHSEFSLIKYCKRLLMEYQIKETWYYDALIMVYAGERTKLSYSGSAYLPSDKLVNLNNVFNIVVSPKRNNVLGAMSRSIIFYDESIDYQLKSSYEDIKLFQDVLHHEVANFIQVGMPFSSIAQYCNQKIKDFSYENLDYRETFGHLIVENLADRIFINESEKFIVKEELFFCFETHLSKKGLNFGLRREDLYAVNNGKILAL